jgi:hypothetical protein
MDGKSRYMDNIFVERLWRSPKYEGVYLNTYASVAEAKEGIGSWLEFYNEERQHQSLGYRTPRQVYEEGLWICGRSASPTGAHDRTQIIDQLLIKIRPFHRRFGQALTLYSTPDRAIASWESWV